MKKRASLSSLKVYLVFALMVVSVTAFLCFLPASQAQTANQGKKGEQKLDGRLRKVLQQFGAVTTERVLTHEQIEAQAAVINTRLELRNGTVYAGVLVRLAGNDEVTHQQVQAALKAVGFSVRARIGNIAALTVAANELVRLAEMSEVVAMSGAGFKYATALKSEPRTAGLTRPVLRNDEVNKALQAPTARAQYNVTGKGVVVGVIDSGIDWKHGDFRKADGSTRIKFLWDMSDQTSNGAPGPNGVGRIYSEAQINAGFADNTQVGSRDTNNHGTHVAGIAAGNGLGTGNGIPAGTFAGVAPEADLVIVKANRPGSSSFADDDQLAALSWIRDRAQELNEPFVINMSLGGHSSQHDGTEAVEQAIDNLLANQNGRQVVIAAGNEGTEPIHAGGILAQGSDAIIPFTLATNKANLLIAVYNAADSISAKIIKPDGTTVGPVALGGSLTSDADINLENSTGNTGSGANGIAVTFKNHPAGTWRLVLTGTKIVNGRYDVWDTGDGAIALDATVRDGLLHVGSPATARQAITAANFVTKTSFLNLQGSTTTKSDEGVAGAGANSSSPGPTRDGRIKPEIGAPGAYVVSTLSADAVNPEQGDIAADGKHIAYTGTSMATPATTGVIALMLQADPSLNAAKIKRLLWRTAKNDNFTGPAISYKFGYGKLNALEAVKAVKENVYGAEFVSISGASYANDLVAAPTAILSGFGQNLTTQTVVATSLPLPSALGGVSVRVTDSTGTARLAPLFFVSPGQINYEIPKDTAQGVAFIEVMRASDNTVVARGAVSVTTAWPGVFTWTNNGLGTAIANVLLYKSGSTVPIVSTSQNPIDLGAPGDRTFLEIYGTGWRTRTGSTTGTENLANVKVTLGGTPLTVTYAGAQPTLIGLDQINVELPQSLAGRGTLDLIIYIDGRIANVTKLTLK